MRFWADFFNEIDFGNRSSDLGFEFFIALGILPFLLAPILWYLLRLIFRQMLLSGNTQLPITAKKAAFTSVAFIVITHLLLGAVGLSVFAYIIDLGAYIALPAALSFFSYDMQWNIIGRSTLPRSIVNIALLELLLIGIPIALIFVLSFYWILIFPLFIVPMYFYTVYRFLKFRCQSDTFLHDKGASLF